MKLSNVKGILLIGIFMGITAMQLFAQCPPEVMNLPANFTVNTDQGLCSTQLNWTPPTYSLDCEDFNGSFASAKWGAVISTPGGGNGTVAFNGMADTLTVTGSTTPNGTVTTTNLCISIPSDGMLSFNWSAIAAGGVLTNDEPAYTIDGTETLLSTMATESDSGSEGPISLSNGQQFCFRVNSNNAFAFTVMDITNFVFQRTEINQTAGPAMDSVVTTGTYTIEYTVEDCSGIEGMCSFDITVVDNLLPEITIGTIGSGVGLLCNLTDVNPYAIYNDEGINRGLPTEITNGCEGTFERDSIANTAGVVDGWSEGESIFSHGLEVYYEDEFETRSECAGWNVRLTRRWYAIDVATADTVTRDQVILFFNSEPEAKAAELEVELGITCSIKIGAQELDNGSSDNCSVTGTVVNDSITYSIRLAGGGVASDSLELMNGVDFDLSVNCPDTVMVELIVTDTCGLADTVMTLVIIEDVIAPEAAINDTIFYGCDTASIGYNVAGYSDVDSIISESEFNLMGGVITDSCGIKSISYIDQYTVGTPDTLYVISRAYTVTDYCENTSTYTQTIYIVDSLLPEITIGTIGSGVGLLCNLTDVNPYAIYNDEGINRGLPTEITNGCKGIFTRDSIANTAGVVDGWSEGESIFSHGLEVYYEDNFETRSECANWNVRLTRRWYAIDVATADTVTRDQVILFFNSEPEAKAAELEVELGITCSIKIGAQELDNGSSDNCSVTGTVVNDSITYSIRLAGGGVASDSLELMNGVDFDLSVNCPDTVMVELIVTDTCGLADTVMTLVIIEDVIAPEAAINDTIFYGCDTASIGYNVAGYSDVDSIISESEFNLMGGVITDSCGIKSISYIDQYTVGTPDTLYVISRAYTVTDYCENTSTYTQTIYIVDSLLPEITIGTIGSGVGLLCNLTDVNPYAIYNDEGINRGLPTEITNGCKGIFTRDSIANTAGVVDGWSEGESIFSHGLEVYYEDNFETRSECANWNVRLTRRWYAIDVATADTVTRDQVILFFNSEPEAKAAELEVELGITCSIKIGAQELDNGSSDNCSVTGTVVNDSITYSIRLAGGGVASDSLELMNGVDFDLSVNCPDTVMVELIVTDTCGLADTVMTLVIIEDVIAPEAAINDTIFYGCDTASIGYNVAGYSDVDSIISESEFNLMGGVITDSCGIKSISYIDQYTVGTPDTLYVISRAYTVTDYCENTSTYTQTIYIVDSLLPEITIGTIGSGVGLLCNLTDVNPYAIYNDEGINRGLPTEITNGCKGIFTRDSIANTAGVVDGWSEGESIFSHGLEVYYEDNFETRSECAGWNVRLTRRWYAIDVATADTVTRDQVILFFNSEPEAKAAELEVELGITCSIKIGAQELDNGSSDNCSVTGTVVNDSITYSIRLAGGGVASDSLELMNGVDFDLSVNCPDTVMVELIVTDTCGLADTVMTLVIIEDVIAPEAAINDTIFYGCDTASIGYNVAGYSDVDSIISESEFNLMGGVITDSCGIKSISYIDQYTVGTPDTLYVISRAYTVTDYCENTSTYTQTIYIVDSLLPEITIGTIGSGVGLLCNLTDVNPYAIYNDEGINRGLPTEITNGCKGIFTRDSIANTAGVVDGWSEGESIFSHGLEVYYEDNFETRSECANWNVRLTRRWYAIDVATADTVTRDQVILFFNSEPEAKAAELEVELGITCSIKIGAQELDNGSSDNCSVTGTVVNDSITYSIRLAGVGVASDSLELINGRDFDLSVNCPALVAVELIVMDTCGLADTITTMVIIKDTMAPQIINCPKSQEIQLLENQCETPVFFSDPTVVDECTTPITAVRTDNTGLNSGDAFRIGKTIISYEAVDDCGNKSTCDVVIEVKEFVGVMVCSKINLTLDEINCEGMVTVDAILDESTIGCKDSCNITITTLGGAERPNLFTTLDIKKTFEYSIECGGSSCWSTVTIEDYTNPTVIECVTDTISCVETIDAAILPMADDNCSAELVEVDRYYEEIECDAVVLGKWTREWIAIDAAGNRSVDTCFQEVYVARTDLKGIKYPKNWMGSNALECKSFNMLPNGAPTPDETGVPSLKNVKLYPFDQSLICNGFVKFEDEVKRFTNDCKIRVQRTWTIGEWHCDTIARKTYVQMIEIIDRVAPIVEAPADLTVSVTGKNCEALVDIAKATITDNCSEIKSVFVSTGNDVLNDNGGLTTLPTGLNTIVYTAEDLCGNVGKDTMTILVKDLLEPIPNCETYTVVSLQNDGQAWLKATSIDDGSFDNCGGVEIAIRRMDDPCGVSGTDFSDRVAFCCEDAGSLQMVELLVTDESENTNSCMVEVEVQDKNTPTITCPGNMTVECDFVYDPFDPATYFGAVDMTGAVCPGNVVMALDILTSETLDDCRVGSVTRTIDLDFNGDIIQTCVQTITFKQANPIDSASIIWPKDVTVTNMCPEFASEPDSLDMGSQRPVVSDGTCNLVGFEHHDKIYPFAGNGACFKIIRTWTVIDWCGRGTSDTIPTFEHDQVIVVENNISPTITSSDTLVSVCSYAVDCSPVPIELTASAFDDCTPVDELQWDYEITFDDGKKEYGSSNDASGTYPIGSHSIEFTVRDKCGNINKTGYDFRIDNCKAPTAYCKYGLSTALIPMDTIGNDGEPDAEMSMLTPEFFDNGSSHVCGYDVLLSFSSDTNDTQLVLDCDNLGRVDIELWVTDINGNQSFCKTFIDVIDSNDVDICLPRLAEVQGRIANMNDESISNSEVQLISNEVVMDITDDQGKYSFGEMPMGGDYQVVPGKDGDDMNGISTLDLVLIQRHILGLEKINNPYLLIAADVNHDDKVTASDLVELRKLILGVDAELMYNTSWRFVDGAYQFPIQDNPWAETIHEDYQIAGLINNMAIDFTGVKIGDVNGNAIANARSIALENRSQDRFTFIMNDAKVDYRQMIELNVTADKEMTINGMQFILNLPDLNLIGIKGGKLNINPSHVNFVDNSELRISYDHKDDKTIHESDILFTLLLTAKKEGILSEMLTINNTYFESEGYLGDNLDIHDIEIQWNSMDKLPKEFNVTQNEPNPWLNSTTIDLYVPNEGVVLLNIFDINGKLIYSKETFYEAGSHSITLNNQDIIANGVFIYEIQFEDKVISKKMISIK